MLYDVVIDESCDEKWVGGLWLNEDVDATLRTTLSLISRYVIFGFTTFSSVSQHHNIVIGFMICCIDAFWAMLKRAVPSSLGSVKKGKRNPALWGYCRSFQWRWEIGTQKILTHTAQQLRLLNLFLAACNARNEPKRGPVTNPAGCSWWAK